MSISERAAPRPAQTFGRIVTEEAVEKALDFLRDNAQEIGLARARVVKAGHMIKHVEALMTLASEQKSVEAKKCDAKTSARWIAAVDEEADAVSQWEKMKALREAASAKLDCWRTESATYRGIRV